MTSADVNRATREANENPVVEYGARAGFAVLGLLHLLIGWIALRVAWGGGGGNADQGGALKSLAGNTGGAVVLWIGVAGFALLALWSITEAVLSRGETSDRLKHVAKGVTYGFFAVSTFRIVALGSGGNSEQQTQDVTQRLMGSPGGQVLVGIVGLVILGIAGYHVYKGWKKKFLEDLQQHPGTWIVRAGRIGYIAKGAALAIVGFFFLIAAWQSDPDDAKGLDGALKSLKDMAFGPYILTVVALGIAAYGVYSIGRARYAKL